MSATADFIRFRISEHERVRPSLKRLHEITENESSIRWLKTKLLEVESEDRREAGPLFAQHQERDAAD